MIPYGPQHPPPVTVVSFKPYSHIVYASSKLRSPLAIPRRSVPWKRGEAPFDPKIYRILVSFCLFVTLEINGDGKGTRGTVVCLVERVATESKNVSCL